MHISYDQEIPPINPNVDILSFYIGESIFVFVSVLKISQAVPETFLEIIFYFRKLLSYILQDIADTYIFPCTWITCEPFLKFVSNI